MALQGPRRMTFNKLRSNSSNYTSMARCNLIDFLSDSNCIWSWIVDLEGCSLGWSEECWIVNCGCCKQCILIWQLVAIWLKAQPKLERGYGWLSPSLAGRGMIACCWIRNWWDQTVSNPLPLWSFEDDTLANIDVRKQSALLAWLMFEHLHELQLQTWTLLWTGRLLGVRFKRRLWMNFSLVNTARRGKIKQKFSVFLSQTPWVCLLRNNTCFMQ